MLILDQVRIPLVGFATQVTIKTVETKLCWPLFAACARGNILFRYVVVFSYPISGPAVFLQYLANGFALFRYAAVCAGEAICGFGNSGITCKMMVTAG